MGARFLGLSSRCGVACQHSRSFIIDGEAVASDDMALNGDDLRRDPHLLVWRKTSLHWSSFDDSTKRHFSIPNQEKQPQGLLQGQSGQNRQLLFGLLMCNPSGGVQTLSVIRM